MAGGVPRYKQHHHAALHDFQNLVPEVCSTAKVLRLLNRLSRSVRGAWGHGRSRARGVGRVQVPAVSRHVMLGIEVSRLVHVRATSEEYV
jgi:hypothetical protein